MFWKYTIKDTKVMLNATLLLFSVFAFFVGYGWKHAFETGQMITANTVGVYAGVEKNEVNTLMAQLEKKEKELDAKEMALVQRQNDYDKYTLGLISLVGFSLFGLILLNFYLDYKKRLSPAQSLYSG